MKISATAEKDFILAFLLQNCITANTYSLNYLYMGREEEMVYYDIMSVYAL